MNMYISQVISEMKMGKYGHLCECITKAFSGKYYDRNFTYICK